MPVGWESHSSPSMEGPPQYVINKQVLAGCDLLVATFWTRIGTPTSEFKSGTIEEIEEHLQAGKPAMIYFSTAPVRLDSVDERQYRALKDFKEQCMKRGLIDTYESLSQFREKFSKQLAQTVIRHLPSSTGSLESAAGVIPTLTPIPDITDEAKQLILAAVDDPNGTLIRLRTLGETFIKIGMQTFPDSQDPRTVAKYEAGIRRLNNEGLIEDRSGKGEVYVVTEDGYRVGDRLRAQG